MVQPQMLGRARRYDARHERRRAEPHHYDISPSAEKVWFVLGLKGLECCSVLVSIVLPKPTLMLLPGEFRRTRVITIGADIYCDMLRIAMELNRRRPKPTPVPKDGVKFDDILSTWADRVLMWPTARYMTSLNRGALSDPFFADRSAMHGHAHDGCGGSQPPAPRSSAAPHASIGRRFLFGRLPICIGRTSASLPISRSINASDG